MLKNYLTIALRNLRRHKGYAVINVAGLAVGIACCLLIVLYVQDELSYDRFHDNADRIYRLTMHPGATSSTPAWPSVLHPLGSHLEASIPDVEAVTRVGPFTEPLVAHGTTHFRESQAFYVEPSFFEVFSFTVLQGDPEALGQPHTVMLTPPTARKYFGDADPIGQTLTFDNEQDYEVVGLVAEAPLQSHIQFDLLVSMASEPRSHDQAWDRLAYTYVLLREGTTPAGIAEALAALEEDVLHPHFNSETTLSLLPLTRIHLWGGFEHDIQPQGDIRYVYLFSAIAALLLLIACINYMNLATARSARRAREVGVRKVVGARRGQLVAQFLGESLLLSLGSLGLAVGLVQLVLPSFSRLMEHPLTLTLSGPVVLALLGGGILLGVLAGSYPALVLSAFRPASVLKGHVRVRTLSSLRRGLVVFQFAISMVLIACTIVIQQQMHYVQTKRLGFDREQVLIVEARDTFSDWNPQAFKDALAHLPVVEQVSLVYALPSRPFAITWIGDTDVEGARLSDEESIELDISWVDYDFVETLGLSLVAGRNFDPAFPSDSESALLINETLHQRLGWTAEEAVGKTLWDDKTVIGVVRDFHTTSLKEAIRPTALQLDLTSATRAVIRLQSDNLQEALAAVQAVWHRFAPDTPFEYSFLDDDFDAMYRTEQRLGQFFGWAAGLAIFVACLGIFGLAAYTAEQRMKEIGIRKVLGASVTSIVTLLSRDFSRLVLVAFIVGCPLAYLGMKRWLQAFAYHINLSGWTFLMAGLAALMIAIGTVSYHAFKAATINPVHALRNEQ